MSFDGTDAALAALQTQEFSTSLPHLAEADQAGQMLDAAMLAEANAAAPVMMSVSAIVAALGEAFVAGGEDFPGLDALIASAEAGEDAWPGDYQIEPATDLELIDGVQHSDTGPIVVTGTRTRFIEIVTDPSPTGATPLPTDYGVIHEHPPEPLIMGVEGDTCPVANTAAKDSLQSLYDNSPTARALIKAAAAAGVSINLFTANLDGSGLQPGFEGSVIDWDPFQGISGFNTNGTPYALTPIMILAHELVHAGNAGNPAFQGANAELVTIAVSNQIASEMNAATGQNYNTNRDSHQANRAFRTQSSTSATPIATRPGCN